MRGPACCWRGLLDLFLRLLTPQAPLRPPSYSSAFPPRVPVWHSHLVQVDGMETHFSRSQLRELGHLLAPCAPWRHTAGRQGCVRGQKTCMPIMCQRERSSCTPSQIPLIPDSWPLTWLPGLWSSSSHLGSWAIREMEARRLAVAAAGQGVVGLKSLGGRRGCTKRLARKASGWEQAKRRDGSGKKAERERRSWEDCRASEWASSQLTGKGEAR